MRASALGADFPRERFLRTPVQAILKLLKYIESEEQRVANVYSAATAILGVQMAFIAHGFSGAKGGKPKVTLSDYLPFPDWKPPTEVVRDGPSPETKAVLISLLRERRIPMHVFTQLNSSPERGT